MIHYFVKKARITSAAKSALLLSAACGLAACVSDVKDEASTADVSSSLASSVVAQESSSVSVGSSSSAVKNDTLLMSSNNYDAPKAQVAPIIDGQIDAVWADAPWMEMNVAWIFESLTRPSSLADFTGKYKAMWTEDHVYLLLDITDDIIGTDGQFWEQDTVEIFVDEDQSGGPHGNDHSAFAYHVNFTGNVEDSGGSIDGHITVAIDKSAAPRYIWEIQMEIYANHNGYDANAQKAARVKLTAGKVMGFTPSYIDNDKGPSREHFMSSVDTPGHQNNQGYLNADSFGTLMLID